MNNIRLVNFRSVSNHPYLVALADLEVSQVLIKGLKLERDRSGNHHIAFPGRRIKGQWQVVCEVQNEMLRGQLRDLMARRLEACGQAA